jgi:hypothetical protein
MRDKPFSLSYLSGKHLPNSSRMKMLLKELQKCSLVAQDIKEVSFTTSYCIIKQNRRLFGIFVTEHELFTLLHLKVSIM